MSGASRRPVTEGGERTLRVVVVARLSDDKLRSKLAPLVAMPEVGELVAPALVERMLREHDARTHNRSRELFAVLVFQLWYDRWQSKPPANAS